MASLETGVRNKTLSDGALFHAWSSEFDGTMLRVQWWIGLLELFVFLIGVPMNIAVLCLTYPARRRAVFSSIHKRTITETFIISMTAADLLFCSIHAPMMFLNFNLIVDFSPIPCLTLFAATHTSTVASSLSLLWLNINKFLHIHRPLHYFLYVNRVRAAGCVGCCWAAAIGWGLLFVFGPFISYDSTCNLHLRHKSAYIVFTTIFFVLPSVVSLIISAYVALVVVESKAIDRSKFHQYGNLRHYRRESGTDPRPNADCDGLAHFRVQFQNRKNKEEKINFASKFIPGSPVHVPSANYRNYKRRRAFSPAYWPPPKTFLHSPSSRRIAHIRRISFVFTTTLWSTLTVLPYRLAFIVNNSLHGDNGKDKVAYMVYFTLFAIMTLNAAGNPFITILTQRKYSAWLKRVWCKVVGQRGDESGRNCNGVLYNACRDSLPTIGETSEGAML